MKVVIVGQGYVGLPLAMSICEAGHEVIGFDLNSKIVTDLNSGISHIEDIDSTILSKWISSGKYRATSNPSDFEQSEIAIIAVPTPLDEKREPDLRFVISASETLGRNLSNRTLIINESTSYPGTLRDVIAPTVLMNSKEGLNHLFAISPERVDPGLYHDAAREPRALLPGHCTGGALQLPGMIRDHRPHLRSEPLARRGDERGSLEERVLVVVEVFHHVHCITSSPASGLYLNG
jgi:nucleotide sugar dehydrogenase